MLVGSGGAMRLGPQRECKEGSAHMRAAFVDSASDVPRSATSANLALRRGEGRPRLTKSRHRGMGCATIQVRPW
jgi:hypothetical protein